MATDEALLKSAQASVATLRFYGWSEPTLSLGYFQSEKLRHSDPLLAELPFVRRPTGGDALVHHHELTYALGLPPGAWQAGKRWPALMHQIIAAALATLGVDAQLFVPTGTPAFVGPLCFSHLTPGDLVIGPAKVVGSAQRKQRGAVLQHGGILLARSRHTPALPGIRELTGKELTPNQVQDAVKSHFAATVGVRVQQSDLIAFELLEVDTLEKQKYRASAWNCKR